MSTLKKDFQKTCPMCGGEGECAYEEAVPDYANGGYLKEVIDTCDLCEGSGVVEDWDDEEDDEEDD